MLSRAEMGRQEIITRSGGAFWLTTAINALAVVIGSLLLLLGVGGCPDRLICGGLPLLVAVALTGQRWGDSRPSSRARFTASARLCTPSLAYTLRKWVLIVFSDTNSS
ncbi:MAG: hypothetical protein WAL22_08590, partial [Solirubrobacteraceae bacterium]